MSIWNKKREVMRRYDLSASLYNMQYSDEQKAKIESALENMKLPKNCALLDVGCGTGLLFPYAEKLASLIVGLDISKGMLKEAKTQAQNFPTIALICGDADYMPFPNNTFEAVFAVTLLQNMPNPLSTLNELKRISKNKATIIVTGLKKEFSLEKFLELLKTAELSITKIVDTKDLKGYIALCKSLKH